MAVVDDTTSPAQQTPDTPTPGPAYPNPVERVLHVGGPLNGQMVEVRRQLRGERDEVTGLVSGPIAGVNDEPGDWRLPLIRYVEERGDACYALTVAHWDGRRAEVYTAWPLTIWLLADAVMKAWMAEHGQPEPTNERTDPQ